MTNPYQPPVEDAPLEEAPSSADYIEASTGQRFANLLLDYIGLTLVSFLLGVVLELIGASNVFAHALGDLFGIVGMTAYYVVCEGLWGRTPGKFVTGTRVVHVDGGPPRFMQIVGRTLVRFVPFEPFSFLRGPPGWHDRWSSTRVVRTR